MWYVIAMQILIIYLLQNINYVWHAPDLICIDYGLIGKDRFLHCIGLRARKIESYITLYKLFVGFPMKIFHFYLVDTYLCTVI